MNKSESLSESLKLGSSDLLARLHASLFLLQVKSGTIADERFLRWLAQDMLWVQEFERFLSVLAARAPREIRRPLFDAIMNIIGEMEVFSSVTARLGIDESRSQMNLAADSYINFLYTMAYQHSTAEALSAAYGTEFSFFEFWLGVKRTQTSSSKWQQIIDAWSGEGFAHWTAALARLVDMIPNLYSEAHVRDSGSAFRTSLLYQLRFMDMAVQDRDW